MYINTVCSNLYELVRVMRLSVTVLNKLDFGEDFKDVMLAGMENASKADFVVIKGDGRTLLGREIAEALRRLRIGPFQANSVNGGRLDGDVRETYKHSFSGVGLLKGYELKLHVEACGAACTQNTVRVAREGRCKAG